MINYNKLDSLTDRWVATINTLRLYEEEMFLLSYGVGTSIYIHSNPQEKEFLEYNSSTGMYIGEILSVNGDIIKMSIRNRIPFFYKALNNTKDIDWCKLSFMIKTGAFYD